MQVGHSTSATTTGHSVQRATVGQIAAHKDPAKTDDDHASAKAMGIGSKVDTFA